MTAIQVSTDYYAVAGQNLAARLQNAEKRGAGFLISSLASLAALVGAIVAVVIDLVR